MLRNPKLGVNYVTNASVIQIKTVNADPSTIQTGMFGINIHRASAYRELENVGANSAGCQVFQDPSEFDIFIDICKKSKEFWGDKFSYTLLEQRYFEI